MGKKVIITGCSGFIGSHLVDYYISHGYEVFGLDIKVNKNDRINLNLIECNLQSSNMEELYMKISPDIFIHCAGSANVGKSVEYPEFDFDSNVTVLYKTLSALLRADLNPKFIFLSSAAVYGEPKVLPIKEDSVLNPISPYGLHKKMCEDLCRYYRDAKKQNISVIRIFSAYGEGLRKQILWDMYQKYLNKGYLELYGTGNETRDFINIKDLIQAIYLVASKNETDFVYNVANGEEISIGDLAWEYGSLLNLEKDKIFFNGKVKAGDPLNWRADISKLKSLGYCKNIDFNDGVKSYVEWVKNIDKR